MIIYDFLKLKNRYKAAYIVLLIICIIFAAKFFVFKQEKYVKSDFKTMEQFEKGIKVDKIISKDGTVAFKSNLDLSTSMPTLNGFLSIEATGKLVQEKNEKSNLVVSKLKDVKPNVEAYGCDLKIMEGPMGTTDNIMFYTTVKLSSTPGKVKKQEMTIEQAQWLINNGHVEVVSINDRYGIGATSKEKLLESKKYLKKVELEYKLLKQYEWYFSIRLRIEDGKGEYSIEHIGNLKLGDNGNITITTEN